MEQAMIDKLIKAGGNRWQKGNYDRIYFNAKTLGLMLTYYNTGNISSAKWAHGAIVPRAELDNQPMVDGYLRPMWDGGMLRYETAEAYDILSR